MILSGILSSAIQLVLSRTMYEPNTRKPRARERQKPNNIRVLLADPRWQSQLPRFLDILGFGRVVSGKDEQERRALFLFSLETAPFIPEGYVARTKETSSRPSAGRLQQQRYSAPSVRCRQTLGYGSPYRKEESEHKRKRLSVTSRPYSSASQTIHS
jgi:hypothetical protein